MNIQDDTLDVVIDHLDATGDGIARHRGQRLSVPFTIPGERVRVQLGPPRGDPRPSDPIEVLEPSPHRIVPRCPHFGPNAEAHRAPCGGCTWQHIAYPEQLRLKTALVDRLVHAVLPNAPLACETIPGTDPRHPWGHRHKVHFVFGNAAPGPARGGAHTNLVMGHYARRSRRLIPVRECPVHDPRGNQLAFNFRDTFARAGVAAADTQSSRASRQPRTGSGVLRSLAIRVGAKTRELMATLVVADDADKRLRTATRKLIDGDPEPPTALHLNVHQRGDAFIFGRETRRLAGTDRMRDEVGSISFLMSPTAFFQTNLYAAEILVRLVVDAVPGGAGVLDLYAGAGLFALPLARRGHRVVAVEENRTAIADGEASQRLNRIATRCRFIATPVEVALSGLRTADVVILDPPRDGCAAPIIERVFGDLRPRRAIYVSCNPDALARDLRLITRHSYSIASLQPVDMFPHTAHVETVAILDRQ